MRIAHRHRAEPRMALAAVVEDGEPCEGALRELDDRHAPFEEARADSGHPGTRVQSIHVRSSCSVS
ncbi:hypothetical protein GCM10027408_11220 [Microbacterium tumbae]